MKRFIIMALVVSNILPMFAQKTILLPSGEIVDSVMPAMPIRTVESVSDGVIVTYEFDKLKLGVDANFNNSSILKLDGFGQNSHLGEPSFPIRWDSFIVPNDADVNIEILDSTFVEIPLTLAPAKQFLLTVPNQPIDTAINIVPFNGYFPYKLVEKQSVSKYRGQSVMNTCINPIKYNYKENKVRAFTRVMYKLVYTNKSSENRNSIINDKITSRDTYLESATINYNREKISTPFRQLVSNSEPTTEDYLIISLPKYEEAVNKLAKWKRTLGYNVHIELNSSWTPSTIKNKVQEVYDGSNALYYLIIIGNHNEVPAKPCYTKVFHYSDMFYACMDGQTDSLPDLARGRISVSNINDANTIIDKIINYERNPIIDNSFYSTGLHCAKFEKDPIPGYGEYELLKSVETSEKIRNYLNEKGKTINRVYTTNSSNPRYWSRFFSGGEPIPEELTMDHFSWNGSTQDIINRINEGSFYVIYGGHSNELQWQSPYFSITDISQLYNQNKLPVIFQISCLAGNFTNSFWGTCLAEAFLEKQGGGAVAAYGATGNTQANIDDEMTLAMFDALWPQPGLFSDTTQVIRYPEFSLGKILDIGHCHVDEERDPVEAKYNREIQHLFGDPSMRMYTMQPTPFTGVETSKSSNIYTVRLLNDSARISFYDKSTGEVTSYTGNTATYNNMNDSVIVCISAPNKIPFIISDNHADNIYIQNETITQTNTYQGNTIKVGSSVTDMKPTGPVVFNGEHITLTGNNVEIQGETTIQQGTVFEINPQ